jgi:hypothetical protein
MKAEDFSAWLCGIARLTAAQRREALEALAKGVGEHAGARLGTEPDASPNGRSGGDSKRRPDALGTSGHERVESRGCPHCAGREIIAWGRANGLTRFGCKSCGRTFNALTKTPMARLRKRELWIDHARAMIEKQKPVEDRRSLRRSSDDRFSLASPVSRIACDGQAASADRHRRGRRDLPPRILQGPPVRFAPQAAQTWRIGETSRPLSGKHSRSYRARSQGRDLRRRLASGRQRLDRRALAGVVTCENHLVCDGGRALAAFARKAKIPLHAVPAPGKPTAEAPHLHINNVNAYHGRLKQWLNRFNGVATKNLPNYLGWRRALEAWGDLATPRNWIKSAIGDGPYQQLTR